MPSDHSKKRKKANKARGEANRFRAQTVANAKPQAPSNVDPHDNLACSGDLHEPPLPEVDQLPPAAVDVGPHSDLLCSGNLTTDTNSRDIQIGSLSLSRNGDELVRGATLDLRHGSFYGLIGSAGCGKSSLLRALAYKLPIPSHMEVCYPHHDAELKHLSIRQYVTSCNKEKAKMEHEFEILVAQGGSNTEAMEWLSTRLQVFDESSFEERAETILYGLGFNKKTQSKKVETLSDYWLTRLALAKALFLKPAVLLLDEPARGLDLETCVWLTEELKGMKSQSIVVLVSNDEEFLNGICSDIIHVHNCGLIQFSGCYDDYNQVKPDEVALSDKASTFHIRNGHLGQLNPPYLQLEDADYRYGSDELIFKNMAFEVELGSRIAVVGANGSGKTTLLNLLARNLTLVKGAERRNPYLRIGHFHQELIENLNLNMSAWEHVYSMCKGDNELKREILELCLPGSMHKRAMKDLSYGQKASIVFACWAFTRPHLLLIDDPTDFLDIKSINSLGNALMKWTGGFVLISNNIRLINKVTSTIWVCGGHGVTQHVGGIMDLKQRMLGHDAYMRKLQDPAIIRDTYPLFAVVNHAEVAASYLLYEEYIDSGGESFKHGCIPFDTYINQRAMVAIAPCKGLQLGEMEIDGELILTNVYVMTTDPGKCLVKSLLQDLHEAEKVGECLDDFDSSNLWITTSGTVRIYGVERKRLCPAQLRRNHMSAHAIIKKMCTVGGIIPADVQYLLDMIEKEPETSSLYHDHACLVPISKTGPFYVMMCEHVLRSMTDVHARDQILLALPYVANQEWRTLLSDNEILLETYHHPNGGGYVLPALPAMPTTEQLVKRQKKEAKYFMRFKKK